MLKLRMAALILIIVGVVGVSAAIADDPAANLGAVYAFGGIGICGFAVMGVSGVYQICRLIAERHTLFKR